jgi:tetratricopeptide (TPR) repeat protein/predicted Ser/Thr protein kinase
MAILPGRRLGPYEILSAIGAGGMGEVYKARDGRLDRIVAIKVLPTHLADRAELRERFEREAKMIASLNHPHICTLFDIGQQDGIDYLVMEYLEGETLAQRLQEGSLPLDQVLMYAVEITEALDVAHRKGVTHRDLKPGNIMLVKSGCKLLDFGLAKLQQDGAPGIPLSQLTTEVDALSMPGMIVGTLQYMAPEQLEGKPADGRTDLYALGLTLYEMVTGGAPFAGGPPLQAMYRQVNEEPKDPRLIKPGLPDYFARIILRCLEKTPTARYQSASEILADLQGTNSPVATRGATRTVQIHISELAKRSSTWAIACALAIVILVLAVPRVRHMMLGGGAAKNGSYVSAIPPLEQGKFVAVLPFRVLGDAQSLDRVAEGLNEALSAKLFQLKDLHLSSDVAAKVSDKDPLEKTGRALGANLLVSGMVQGSPENLRIIVNLDDVNKGKRTWSQGFSGVLKDLLSIEDQISAQLVTALALKPTNEEMARTAERPTYNVEAYDLYLRGRQSLNGPDSVKAPQKAIDYFQQAIQKDPAFALAFAGLADASVAIYENTKDSFWAQKAVGAAERARELKDNAPEVHFSLGFVYQQTGKTAQAIAELKRGLQLAPNSDGGYRRLGNAYLDSGQKDEAITAYKKGIEVNPYSWALHIELGRAYFSIGQNENALEEFRRVTELEPENVTGWNNAAGAYERMGRYQESIPAYLKSIELAPTWLAYSNLGYVYTVLKQYPQAIQALEKAVELGPNQELPVGNLADAYRYSGQKVKADVMYDKAIALAFHELQVNPQSTNAMGDLAVYFAKKGETLRAREFIQRARAIDKEDVELIFSQATVENLGNNSSDSIRTLRYALSKGYPVKDLESDPVFDNLKNRPEFQALIKEFNQPAK